MTLSEADLTTHQAIVSHILHNLMACSPEFTHSAHVDCDWSGIANDPCSTTGFYFFLVSSLISQKNKKQTAVSSS